MTKTTHKRIGKTGRLSKDRRHKLGQRIEDAQPGADIVQRPNADLGSSTQNTPDPMNPQTTEPTELQQERDAFLKQFRAYLHLLITAHQTGQAGQIQAMPGPDLLTYCRQLVDWPGHRLADELAKPLTAILQELCRIPATCQGILRRQDQQSKALHGSAGRILAQIDLAFGFILRDLNYQIESRGEVTKDPDLLCQALLSDTQAGSRTAGMLRRFEMAHRDEGGEDGSFAEDYAWDVYRRVEELDRLADEFPDLIRLAARRMHAWPMLIHPHTNHHPRFQELAQRLELGAEYPSDTNEQP
jgi:hypothetical protein